MNSVVTSAGPQRLSEHTIYAGALAARDRDVLECLRRVGGRRIELSHAVVVRRQRAPSGSYLMACAVGQPVGWPIDETARWRADRRGAPP